MTIATTFMEYLLYQSHYVIIELRENDLSYIHVFICFLRKLLG